MTLYTFIMEGRGRDNSFSVNGDVTSKDGAAFSAVAQEALRQGFLKVTGGKAVYGNPGTCSGPYTITKFVVERASV